MKRQATPRRETAFRALLVLGAAVSIAIGVWAIAATGSVQNTLAKVSASPTPEFAALSRMYGAAMLALGIGYAIAAAHPHGHRSLLVVLFAAPALTGVVQIANIARGEIPAGRGIAFAVYDIAYCLLYFRTYPRVEEPPAPPPIQPPLT